MAATKHTRPHPFVPRADRLSAGEPYAANRMLADAAALDLRAPELALVLGERASALAEAAGAAELWVRAESLVVSARVRMGLRAVTVARAVAALRTAEDLGDDALVAGLRTDLAICARSVGAPLTGLAALRRVLDMPGCSGAARAAALCHLVGCLYQFGQKPDLDRMLTEADRLCGVDDGLDDDGKLVARALVRVAVSAHRRRHGDVMGAADAARTGLGFLQQLEDPQADGGVARVRLVVQLVCSLLDRGDSGNALEIARPVLDEPVRAASVAPVGWLRFAVATRILLPSGAVEAAAGMLREGVHSTQRHELHALTAHLWWELAHVENRLGCPSEAIECLHQGRAEEHVYARARRQAMSVLSGEFGNGGHPEVDLDEVLGSTLSVGDAPRPAPSEPVTELRESEQRRRIVEQPVAATLAGAHQRGAAEPAVQRATEQRPTETRSADERGTERRTEERRTEECLVERDATEERPVERDATDERPADKRLAGQPALAQRATPPQRTERAVPVPATDENLAEAPAQRRSTAAHQHSVEQSVAETSTLATRFKVAPVVALWSQAEHQQAETASPREPVKPAQPNVEDLAPPPADQPRPPLGFEALIRPPVKADGEGGGKAAGEGGETRGRRRAREVSVAKMTTRHDSEHGSVAARSVLDRLGISAGGGGRRRAEPEAEPSATKPTDAPAESPASADPAATKATRKKEPVAEPPAPERDAPAAAEPDPAATESESVVKPPTVNDNWLPRLKLPPSLAPFDESSLDDQPLDLDDKSGNGKPISTSETPFTNAPVIEDGQLGAPFPVEYSGAPLDDDLPPDAGLADLLARALAEHQAGTASAAALVKRFGGQNSGEAPTVNGHGRSNGEAPPNGRHRNGS